MSFGHSLYHCLQDDTMRVLYAYGGRDPTSSVPTWNDYHGTTRGSIFLVNAMSHDQFSYNGK